MSSRLNPPRRRQIAESAKGATSSRTDSQRQSAAAMNSGSQHRSWSYKPTAKIVLCLIGGVAALAVAVVAVRSYLLESGTPGDPNLTVYVDSTTGQSFSHRNQVGEAIPIVSPYTNQKTGYPGVPCFWTKDGTLRKEPFWLILNSALGKAEPTFCPDCGRLVRPRQSAPRPGDRPPPTQQELLYNR